jgi:hypothetical protein
MKPNKRRKLMLLFLVAPPAFLLFIALGGEVVKQLWNWLLPSIFGWREVSFWQALGLLALCRILFGGFGFHGAHRSGLRHRIGDHWERMSPEERERLRQMMRERWGHASAGSESPGQ